MKRKLILASTLMFSTYSFAGADSNQLHSAIQSAFSNVASHGQNSVSMIYSGKDISRPTMAVRDERMSSLQATIIG